MKNWTLRQRILASFAVVIAIMLLMVVFSYVSLLAVEPETSANLLAFVVADGFSAIVGDLDDEMLESVQAAYGGEALTIGDRNYISVVEAGSLIFLTFYQGVRVGFELLMAGEAPTADETELLTEFVGAVAFL